MEFIAKQPKFMTIVDGVAFRFTNAKYVTENPEEIAALNKQHKIFLKNGTNPPFEPLENLPEIKEDKKKPKVKEVEL